MLKFLYFTKAGRLLLRLLTARWLSQAVGKFMDSRLSRCLIGPFIRKNGIQLSEYQPADYNCFNDCFTRKILPENRPVDTTGSSLIAPCDGRLSAYKIDAESRFAIKNSVYTVNSLLPGYPDAQRFTGGTCLIFRLCVDDYHRYHYFDSGVKEQNVFVPGKLHTVRPIAVENVPVFVENCREYTIMHTENFGTAAQIEVGAMLVGKIKNHHGAASFCRGDEKGMFLYGGSTVVLLLEPDTACISEEIFAATQNGCETRVRFGQTIGKSTQPQSPEQ